MKTAACGPVNPQPTTNDNSLFVVELLKFCDVFENALIGSEFCGRPLTRHDTDPLCDVFAKQSEEVAA